MEFSEHLKVRFQILDRGGRPFMVLQQKQITKPWLLRVAEGTLAIGSPKV